MKKCFVLSVLAVLLVLFCAMPIQAWQGRMGAMGNASGLVEDESDFLTHPAAIAGGKGFNVYGHLGFMNSWIDKFSFSTKILTPATGVSSTMVSEAAGKEWQLDGLTGFALPVGTGRMGVFFQYTGVDGALNGDQIRDWSTGLHEAWSFDIKNKIDDLALRFLYAVPFGANMKLGGEFQIGQKTEKFTSFIGGLTNTTSFTNAAYGPWGDDVASLLQYGVPRDSQYYEASLKASIEAKMGPATAAFTARGGMPIGGTDNHYVHERFTGSVSGGGADMYGKIKGYNVGADAWVRLPLSSSLTLPFLVTFDFKDMKRDGDGPEFGAWGAFGNWSSMYENKEKTMTITAGGGADFTPAKDTKIAGGLYYTYLNAKTTYNFAEKLITSSNWTVVRNSGYPETKEHKVSLKLSGEKALSSALTVNGGFNAFYGWVKQGYNYDFHNSAAPGTAAFDTSLKGKHWGLGASLGLSMPTGTTTFEPYIAGGLERYDLSGNGTSLSNGVVTRLITDSALKKHVLTIGAGIALRY